MDKITIVKPALHQMARKAIEKMAAQGLHPTPEHVIWLQNAAADIKNLAEKRIASLIDWPVYCGGVKLYPLTFGAMQWLNSIDQELSANTNVQAFACANSRELDVLNTLHGHREIMRAVRDWRRNVLASPDALSAALNVVIGMEDTVEIECSVARKNDSESKRVHLPQFGGFILALCRRYPGTTPEWWCWGVSFDYALAALDQAQEDTGEEGAVTSREIRATANFLSLVNHIENELKNLTTKQEPST